MAERLLRSTVTVGSMTLLSRILGFARDMVIARFFGAGAGTDAFFVAFKIPNFLRRLFAEGAFSQAFVPVLGEHRTQRGPAEVRLLNDRVAGMLGAALLAATAVGVLAAPVLVALFAPGFLDEPEKFDLTVTMLRITFPYLLFISLTAFAGAILNTYSRFAVPAFTPVFLNLAMIGAAVWLAPYFRQPVIALAWGVFAGGVVQLAFQLPYLKQLGLMPRPRLEPRDPAVRRILRLMAPALFGVSITQINLLIDTLIASFLVTGSVSWLYYSDRLLEFPLGVFGIALGTVILPSLSRHHAAQDPAQFSATLDWALRLVVLIGTPAMLGLMLLAAPMLATLFQYQAFSGHDVEMSARSLMAYALGLPGFVLIKVLAPGFYARQDMKTPVRIGVIAMITNLACNLALVVPLQHTGLALATSIAAWVNAGLLFRGLRRSGIYTAGSTWGWLAPRALLANAAMALVLVWLTDPREAWLAWGALDRAWHLALVIGAGIAVYTAALAAGGLRLRHLRAAPPAPDRA